MTTSSIRSTPACHLIPLWPRPSLSCLVYKPNAICLINWGRIKWEKPEERDKRKAVWLFQVRAASSSPRRAASSGPTRPAPCPRLPRPPGRALTELDHGAAGLRRGLCATCRASQCAAARHRSALRPRRGGRRRKNAEKSTATPLTSPRLHPSPSAPCRKRRLRSPRPFRFPAPTLPIMQRREP